MSRFPYSCVAPQCDHFTYEDSYMVFGRKPWSFLLPVDLRLCFQHWSLMTSERHVRQQALAASSKAAGPAESDTSGPSPLPVPVPTPASSTSAARFEESNKQPPRMGARAPGPTVSTGQIRSYILAVGAR